MPHTKGSERVHHGIRKTRRASDGARLAHALHTQRIHGRGSHGSIGFDPGHVAGAGNGVVGQLAGDELALVVVNSLLKQRLAHGLHDSAVNLPIDEERINHIAAIVHGDILLHADIAGIGIDFNDAQVRAEGKCEVRGLKKRGGIEAGVNSRGQCLGDIRRRNTILKGD